MSAGFFQAIQPGSLAASTSSLAESREVFVNGNNLCDRFAELPTNASFVIVDTQFGAGTNFLTAAAAFHDFAHSSCRLHFIAIEKNPLTGTDLRHALARLTEKHLLAEELSACYPPLTPGFHRRALGNDRIQLTLAMGEINAMLEQLDTHIDAWFLDSDASKRELLRQSLLTRLSKPSATLAYSTSLKELGAEFNDAGAALHYQKSSAETRQIVTGKFETKCDVPPQNKPRKDPRNVAIIGAGLAGITTAAALQSRGIKATLIDPQGIANGASGNLAGVVYTTPSAHQTPQNRFYQSSYLFSLNYFQQQKFPRTNDDGALNGVLQFAKNSRLADKANAALESGVWPQDIVSKALSTTDEVGALMLHRGGYLSPPRWCRFLFDRYPTTLIRHTVKSLRQHQNHWSLELDNGEVLNSFTDVIIANAGAASELVDLPWLTLKSIRGQVSYVAATTQSSQWAQATCHAGYLTPAIEGLHCVGATFDLDRTDLEVSPSDDLRNLQQLREHLPEKWQEIGGDDAHIVDRRVGIRCQSTDFLPVVGELSGTHPGYKGLWLNIAHGSRGITGTPLCAELLACELAAEPLPIDKEMKEALLPIRFLRRKQRRR
ncbi:MAG: FAD-dependent 5-carboxymethylaminomethyl-2-thiouridine(34) oxidoreductase MnmC [Alcanivoracaceae bacterium]|nr:FAD-dependent 5-carboxymethylaminomethyl-2-thiouridine(34) oxidoreductase MnmC [Alcanivoracaceae bacterium]